MSQNRAISSRKCSFNNVILNEETFYALTNYFCQALQRSAMIGYLIRNTWNYHLGNSNF